MIVLLGLLVPRLVPRRLVTTARERLDRDAAYHGEAAQDPGGYEGNSLAGRLRQRSRWADAAGYTISDLAMLRREIIIGFVVAGFAAAAVPAGFWNAVFLHGHGPSTMIENAIVGPFVAIISFVCSVGNVPLAAALWKDGISFGGVMAFIFADLISLPLLFIYRKLYGKRLTLRLLGVFWLVMSVAGLMTELIFKTAAIIPATRPGSIAPEHLSRNYTTILNIVFLFVLAAIFWLHCSRERFGGGQDVARDPVCGMQVDKHHPGAILRAGGQTTYFCSEHCRDRYTVTTTPAARGQA